MDDVKNQLVKDVAELKQVEQITEARVREIAKEEIEAAKPPVETKKVRRSLLSSRKNES